MVDIEKDEIDGILARPLLARIATTGNDMDPHVVPVWFWWDGECIYIETGIDFRKARNLRENPKCAVLIDDTQGGLCFWGIFMRGEVELITEPVEWIMEVVRRIYLKYLGAEGILAPTPQKMINSQHVIIKFTPKKIVTWDDTRSEVAPID
jgi:nitroimidazol reductase NimA-like FMN-containing flavoprotein (pyridoxamine 5'-phosphate oxidase superfamily)